MDLLGLIIPFATDSSLLLELLPGADFGVVRSMVAKMNGNWTSGVMWPLGDRQASVRFGGYWIVAEKCTHKTKRSIVCACKVRKNNTSGRLSAKYISISPVIFFANDIDD